MIAASESGGLAQIFASHASGNSCWHLNHGGQFAAWCCSETRDLRESLQPPRDRAEERIFAKAVGEFPRATFALDIADFACELQEALRKLLSEAKGEACFAATDGSSRYDIAASANVFSGEQSAPNSFAAGLGVHSARRFFLGSQSGEPLKKGCPS